MTTTAQNDDPNETPADLQYVDPATLLVDTNIRQTRIDKAFTASIRQHGVLVPIVAVRADDGLRVRYGHRRAFAAIEAGRALVPVYVTGPDDADEAARIVGQWSENEHRTALTTGERIGAIEQLSLLGLSAGQIAHRTRASKADVQDALAASASELARKAADRYGFLTLEQSAVLAEFDGPDRDEEAITALIAAAHEGQVQFDRALLAARERAAERQARNEAADALTTAGVPVMYRAN